jgi:hypothetical protein
MQEVYFLSQLIKRFLMRVSLSGEIFPKRALITDDSTLVNRPSRIKEATLSPVVI